MNQNKHFIKIVRSSKTFFWIFSILFLLNLFYMILMDINISYLFCFISIFWGIIYCLSWLKRIKDSMVMFSYFVPIIMFYMLIIVEGQNYSPLNQTQGHYYSPFRGQYYSPLSGS